MALSYQYDNLPSDLEDAHPMPGEGEDHSARLQAVLDQMEADMNATGETSAELEMPSGTFHLDETVEVPSGVTIKGAGSDYNDPDDPESGFSSEATVFEASDSFIATDEITDHTEQRGTADENAYLFNVGSSENVTFEGVAMTGDTIHGGILSDKPKGLTIDDCAFNDFMWTGVRSYVAEDLTITDSSFHNAGGEKHADTGTHTLQSGQIYVSWANNATITNNTITDNQSWPNDTLGISGHQWVNSNISYNTIDVESAFAIEIPHGNSRNVDIHNNYLNGNVSVPKPGGGYTEDAPGDSFHIYNNLFVDEWSIEMARDGLLIEENVFLDDRKEGEHTGRVIASYGNDSEGPMEFSNNLVVHESRGIYWSHQTSDTDELTFTNNHIVVQENDYGNALFEFSAGTDHSTIEISNNVIEVEGDGKNLINTRTGDNSAVVISNNALDGVNDTDSYDNPQTEETQGLAEPLEFSVGANGAYHVSSEVVLDAVDTGQDPLDALDASQDPTDDPEEEPVGSIVRRGDEEDDGIDSIRDFFEWFLSLFGLGGGDSDAQTFSYMATDAGSETLLSDLVVLDADLDQTPSEDELDDLDDSSSL